MKPIIQTSNTSNTAHVKISVAKITPTITFTARDSVDTPPAITPYVMSLAQFVKNHNEITAHISTAKTISAIILNDEFIYVKRYGDPSKTRPRPLWVCKSAPANGKKFGRDYASEMNIQRKDKPTFRSDTTIFFDKLSEDYNA